MEHICSSAWSKRTFGSPRISVSLSRAPASTAPICSTLRELCARPSSSAASQLRTRLSSSAARRLRKPVTDSSAPSEVAFAEELPVMPLRPTSSSEMPLSPRCSRSSALELPEELATELPSASSSGMSELRSELSACWPWWTMRKNSRSVSERPVRREAGDMPAPSRGRASGCSGERQLLLAPVEDSAEATSRLSPMLPRVLSFSTRSRPSRRRARLGSEGMGLAAAPPFLGGDRPMAQCRASAARTPEPVALYSYRMPPSSVDCASPRISPSGPVCRRLRSVAATPELIVAVPVSKSSSSPEVTRIDRSTWSARERAR
mmetsp:Transcript_74123/g.239701  ORF Transcript_74123/g.239701 Transcript_74123/m.239701 type:complete len:319 (+) Transcript_74123:277-1233(+)